MESTHNPMLIAAEPLLVTSNDHTPLNYDAVCQTLIQFEKQCTENNYIHTEIDDARFFLCIFLDKQQGWQPTLCNRFYPSLSHEETDFLKRLKCYETNPSKHSDLLELAYICLSLGFENQIATRDHLYQYIRDARENLEIDLLIDTPDNSKKIIKYLPPIGLTVTIALALLILIFTPYNKKLNQYLSPVVSLLQKQKEILETNNRVIKTHRDNLSDKR